VRWFVKTATTAAAVASLRGAIDVHRAVRHTAIIPLHAVIEPRVDGRGAQNCSQS
jgi:serine/threonine-protein kinase